MTTYSPMFVPLGARLVYKDPKTGKEIVLMNFPPDDRQLVKEEVKRKRRRKCCANCGLATFDKQGNAHCETIIGGEKRKMKIFYHSTHSEGCEQWKSKTEAWNRRAEK